MLQRQADNPFGNKTPFGNKNRQGELGMAGEHEAPLLDPGVPGDAEAGELRHLLPAQPGRPAPSVGGKADRGGGDLLALGAEEQGQRVAPGEIRRLYGGGRDTSINGPLKPMSM